MKKNLEIENKKPILLYYINVDWSFLSHRIDLAKKAISEGYEVHLLTNITTYKKIIENHGIVVHESYLSRKFNLLKDVQGLFKLISIIIKIKPDIIHAVSNKNIILGSIIGRIFRIKKIILAVSGLGYIYLRENILTKFFKKLLSIIYGIILRYEKSYIIVQNRDDLNIIQNFAKKDTQKRKIILIPGSGVDTNYFRPSPEKDGKIIISLVARMIYDKGIKEFVCAAKILSKKYSNIEFNLFGRPDIYNPSSIEEKKLVDWDSEKILRWRGYEEDSLSIYHQSHIIVLPSYREGMPKVILEASACGRPSVVTNVPGCKESIIPNKTGLLVKLFDVDDLVKKIEQLIINKEMRIAMGSQARRFAEQTFDINIINQKQIYLYIN
tara:strand:+ start:99 stop:1244 length:1146 start_codon:yes stop_codon:yes gene_type:complete